MAENKATTLEQLRALAERGKLDTLNRVDQLLESIIPLLEGAQHSGTTVTLPAENWSGRAQTVKDNILLADEKYWYIVCADADCFMAVSETGVKADNITVNGQHLIDCLAEGKAFEDMNNGFIIDGRVGIAGDVKLSLIHI